MKVTGLITEYNPFHNGHAYHLQKSKALTGADYLIAVMSGDFVQRGAPAVIDKCIRTRMALEGGADLVLELPARYALGSADFFAAGSVSLLESLGVTDAIAFGSEEGSIVPFLDIASLLCQESRTYQDVLRREISSGLSYPAAREKALAACYPQKADDFHRLLSSPNNILGIEYCKSLHRFHSDITPFTVRRRESDYHQKDLTEQYSSATALRRHLKEGDISRLNTQMPPSSWELLNHAARNRETADTNDYSLLLKYRLMNETSSTLPEYQDVSEELANRIQDQQNRFDTFEGFISLLKTRQMTYTRIARALFHILLNIRRFTLSDEVCQVTPYGRILGFRKSASPLLHEIKKRSQIPLISKVSGRKSFLTPDACRMLEEDIWCANLYESVMAMKNQRPFRHEASRPLIII
ncbi:MAG: nucleotidyltransferase [Ruminococcus sp.]